MNGGLKLVVGAWTNLLGRDEVCTPKKTEGSVWHVVLSAYLFLKDSSINNTVKNSGRPAVSWLGI